jgi:hypothetical protein
LVRLSQQQVPPMMQQVPTMTQQVLTVRTMQ